MILGRIGALAAIAMCFGLLGLTRSDDSAGSVLNKAQLRRPLALVLADEGRRLLVANRDSGTLSVIDFEKKEVVAEHAVGKRLVDLALSPDGKQVVVVDEAQKELIILDSQEMGMAVRKRLSLGHSPASVILSKKADRAYVSLLWARQALVVSLGHDPKVEKTIALPFNPRKMVEGPDGKHLLVADSFGGRLSVIDLEKGKVESTRTFPGHNIRGLVLADGKLFLAHQILRTSARTTPADIHWGNLITNVVRTLDLKQVAGPDADLLAKSDLVELGDVRFGAGDPSGLALAPDGSALVTLGGTSEATFGKTRTAGNTWARVPVGKRPTAAVVDSQGRRAFVANTFSDSVSVVDLEKSKVETEISLGSAPTLNAVERGEVLFHDAKLSLEGWLSCHSCHTDGHTNGMLNDNQSDGTFGTPKRVLSLLGVKDTPPWAWNGGITDLKDQIRKSITLTMRGPKPSDEQVSDLEAYLKTLTPPPPVEVVTKEESKKALARGKDLFNTKGCISCHEPPTYTSKSVYDVGMKDEAGLALFNPPSLRGISQGGPYFHDGRAATLEEVVGRFRHQLKTELTKEERDELIVFLKSL